MTGQTLRARVDEVTRFSGDLRVRNLQITQLYNEVAGRMGQLLGTDSANWCHFACWASKTAGTFIRDEEIPSLVRSFLQSLSLSGTPSKLENLATQLPGMQSMVELIFDHDDDWLTLAARVVARIRSMITMGNLSVFAELGGLFASFVDTFERDDLTHAGKLETILASIRRGQAAPDHLGGTESDVQGEARGGQDLLRQAMNFYAQVLLGGDSQSKSELILLANINGGLHEQTRLQSYIVGSLNAAIDILAHELTNDHFLARIERRLSGRDVSAFGQVFSAPKQVLALFFRYFATEHLMRMELPTETIYLGHDLGTLPTNGSAFSQNPPENPELQALLHRYAALDLCALPRYDPYVILAEALAGNVAANFGKTDLVASRAWDWGDLDQRMHFIAIYFRTRQNDPQLWQQPFTADQRVSILRGELPPGRL